MKRWKERIRKWKFDRKMQALIIISITFTTLLVLVVSTISSVTSLKEKSIELLQDKNDTLAENYQNMLEEYKAMAIALAIDRAVQRYLGFCDKQASDYTQASTEAHNVLSSSLNMSRDLNFIAIVSYQMEDYLFRGKEALASTEFQKVYKENYRQCKKGQKSTLKVGFSNAYFKGKKYTVNVYFPVYSVETLMKERGLLCMNFSNPVLNQIIQEKGAGQRTEVVDADGTVIAAGDMENIGLSAGYMDRLSGNQGSFYQNGRIYIYRKVYHWNFYIISSIEIMELYRPSIRTICFMAGILVILILISYFIVKRVICIVYRPLDGVVQKMDDVAAGFLDVRIDVEGMGEDFAKLAVGFNSMMEEILVLMERVKQEQHQIEQIRFNSLQSQIQPHFLYNTLECIHWQASADGNKKVSQLILALASYYRLSLSKGKDILPLKEELEHAKIYLMIQNQRFGNVIKYYIEIPESLHYVRIPKLTLQPLVENSIYHGIRTKEGGAGIICISAIEKNRQVIVTVEDSGTVMTQEQIDQINHSVWEYGEKLGYGVNNVHKRIQLAFGEQYGLKYKLNQNGGTTVLIYLPKDDGVK